MGAERVRRLWAEDKPAFGLWVAMSDPAIVEIAAYAGFDYVSIDMEHTALDFQTVENMIRAAEARGITPMVRVPENNPKTILRAVELGPGGIYIPHIRDAADARKAVDAARYRPIGDRGISASTRAARYGLAGSDFIGFTKEINENLIVYAMIEEQSAVDDIEAIASTDGVDVCGIAPADLARSVGQMGTHNAPEVAKVVEYVATTVRRVGKARLGLPASHGNFEVGGRAAAELGARMISCSLDARVLLAALRKTLGEAKGGL